MGKKVYFPFGIVTLIQFIGNIFFAYQYIDITSVPFKDWVELVDPIVSYLGVESGDDIGHKRFLALLSGGMLPIISLSFLHMLVKFEEEEKKNSNVLSTDSDKLSIDVDKMENESDKDKYVPTDIDIDKLSIEAGKMENEYDKDKYTPTEDELKKLEEELIKLNEQKFGTLEDVSLNIGDDSLLGINEINESKKKQGYFPEKKVLNYFRRDV